MTKGYNDSTGKDYVKQACSCKSTQTDTENTECSIITNDTVEKQFENRLTQLRYLA